MTGQSLVRARATGEARSALDRHDRARVLVGARAADEAGLAQASAVPPQPEPPAGVSRPRTRHSVAALRPRQAVSPERLVAGGGQA